MAVPGKIIAFASGKGGVGKTSLCLNFAYQLVQSGKKVVILDADLGLANADVQLGVVPQYDLTHLLSGAKQLHEIIIKTERGIDLISGQSGSDAPALFDALQRRSLLDGLRDLTNSYDYVLLDVAAGVDDDALNFANFADETLLIVTPDPSSLTDAYAVVKLLTHKYGKHNCRAVINQAGAQEGQNTYNKLNTAAEKFLQTKVPLLGIVPYDRQYATAVKLQKLTSEAFAESDASKAIGQLILKL